MRMMYERVNDGCGKWKWMDMCHHLCFHRLSIVAEDGSTSTSVSLMWMCEWFRWSTTVGVLVVVSPSVFPHPPSSWSCWSCLSGRSVCASVKCRRPFKVHVTVACVVEFTVAVAVAVAVGLVVVSVLVSLVIVGVYGSRLCEGGRGEEADLVAVFALLSFGPFVRSSHRDFIACQLWCVILWAFAKSHIFLPPRGYLDLFFSTKLSKLRSSVGVNLDRRLMARKNDARFGL